MELEKTMVNIWSSQPKTVTTGRNTEAHRRKKKSLFIINLSPKTMFLKVWEGTPESAPPETEYLGVGNKEPACLTSTLSESEAHWNLGTRA